MFCRKCGNEIPDDSTFCPKCGECVVIENIEETAGELVGSAITLKKVDAPSTAEFGMLICKECGKPIPEGNMFCPVCGMNIPSNEIAVTTLPEKKSKLKIIIIAASVLVAVIAIVYFGIIQPEQHLEFNYKQNPENGYYIILGAKKDMKEINIPDTIWFKPVYAVADEAFKNSSAESVSFGKNIAEIGERAFERCTELKSAAFKATYENSDIYTISIGSSAFYNCSSLNNLTLPSINTVIGDGAFYKCRSLKKVYLGNVSSVGQIAFGESGLTSLEIDCNVGMAAFGKCTDLNTVQIYSWATLDSNVFEGCSNLKEATIYTSTIPAYTFSMCSNLEKVYWNITSYDNAEIGNYAFVNCSSLSEIVTSDLSLDNLKGITDYNSQIAIGEGAFDGCVYFKINHFIGNSNESSVSKKSLKDYTGMELSEMSYKTFTEKFGMPESYFWGKAQYSDAQVGFKMTGDYGTSSDGFDPYSDKKVDYVIIGGGTDRMINKTMHLGEGLDYYNDLLSFDVYDALTMGAGDHGMQWYELNIEFTLHNTPAYYVCIMFNPDTMKSYAAKIEHV